MGHGHFFPAVRSFAHSTVNGKRYVIIVGDDAWIRVRSKKIGSANVGGFSMREETVTIPVAEGEEVSGIISIPESGERDTGIILAHGAGNDMNHPMIRFLAEGLADTGHITLRFNFLYREKGRKSPDNQDWLYLAWEGAYRFLANHHKYRPNHLVAAGKSLGGRIASQMVAERKLQAEGVIFLGYPLHAPGRKDKLRDGHLYEISIPMLFFAGTRDSLCNPELLKGVLSRLKAPWELEVIEGADHSFNLPKSYGIDQWEVYRRVLYKSLAWLSK
jgi:uncharacterized protein